MRKPTRKGDGIAQPVQWRGYRLENRATTLRFAGGSIPPPLPPRCSLPMNKVAGVCNLATTSTKYRGQEHVELYVHFAIHFHYEVYNQTRKAKLQAATHKFYTVLLLHVLRNVDIRRCLQNLLFLQRHKVFSYIYIHVSIWDRRGTVVKVLCYKSEGRWFDWNFSLT
jgi:hypothetical protein